MRSTVDLRRREPGDLRRIEAGERLPIALALVQDRPPGEARLGSLEREHLEQVALVVARHAPFLVVVGAGEHRRRPDAQAHRFGTAPSLAGWTDALGPVHDARMPDAEAIPIHELPNEAEADAAATARERPSGRSISSRGWCRSARAWSWPPWTVKTTIDPPGWRPWWRPGPGLLLEGLRAAGPVLSSVERTAGPAVANTGAAQTRRRPDGALARDLGGTPRGRRAARGGRRPPPGVPAHRGHGARPARPDHPGAGPSRHPARGHRPWTSSAMVADLDVRRAGVPDRHGPPHRPDRHRRARRAARRRGAPRAAGRAGDRRPGDRRARPAADDPSRRAPTRPRRASATSGCAASRQTGRSAALVDRLLSRGDGAKR